MTHDQKLLNEYKIKLEADLMELDFFKFSTFDKLEFLEELRHIVLTHTIDLEFELSCESDYELKNNPAKY
jgi:hypothetical protein